VRLPGRVHTLPRVEPEKETPTWWTRVAAREEPAKEKPPWWQATRTPRQAIFLGCGNFVICVGVLITWLLEGEWQWPEFLIVFLSGVVGTIYIASATAQIKSRSRRPQ
jgi:hypothetical protein